MASRSKRVTVADQVEVDATKVLGCYQRWLARQPLAGRTRDAYCAQVYGFVDWVAGSEHGGAARVEAHVQDWAVRDYKRHVKACRDHKVRYSITAPQNYAVKRAIEEIDEDAWTPITYTENGEAWVAETGYGDGHRLVVRRTKLADPQPALFPVFRYHAFITDRVGDAVTLDADHRRHAVVELAIRDLKDGGLAHCPSGNFSANGAWAVLATIATMIRSADRWCRVSVNDIERHQLRLLRAELGLDPPPKQDQATRDRRTIERSAA